MLLPYQRKIRSILIIHFILIHYGPTRTDQCRACRIPQTAAALCPYPAARPPRFGGRPRTGNHAFRLPRGRGFQRRRPGEQLAVCNLKKQNYRLPAPNRAATPSFRHARRGSLGWSLWRTFCRRRALDGRRSASGLGLARSQFEQ